MDRGVNNNSNVLVKILILGNVEMVEFKVLVQILIYLQIFLLNLGGFYSVENMMDRGMKNINVFVKIFVGSIEM